MEEVITTAVETVVKLFPLVKYRMCKIEKVTVF